MSSLDPNKYYVHVRDVKQYFPPDDKRVTVFEQNHNVTSFSFDLGLDQHADIGDYWMKKTICTIDHPMPYIVKRVKVPEGGVRRVTLSPIEKSCGELREEIAETWSAIRRRDYQTLQRLLHGALLPQVNKGPMAIAEEFLGKRVEDKGAGDKQRQVLREVFREFIQANKEGVQVHLEYVKKKPVHTAMQEWLEGALNRLASDLQPYLEQI